MRRLLWISLIVIPALLLGSCATIGSILEFATGGGKSSTAPGNTPPPNSGPSGGPTTPPPQNGGQGSGKSAQAAGSTIKGQPVDAKAANAAWLKAGPGTRKVGSGADLSNKGSGAFGPQDGGWAMYRVTDGKKINLMSMATFRDKDLWIYELVTYEGDAATAVQLIYRDFDKIAKTGRADAAELVELWMMDQKGELNKVEGAMLGMMSGAYAKSLATPPGESITFTPGGPVSVPFGTFATTWVGTSSNSKGKAWINTEAPFFHLVKSESDNVVMELVDGAASGYKSVMPTLAERAGWQPTRGNQNSGDH